MMDLRYWDHNSDENSDRSYKSYSSEDLRRGGRGPRCHHNTNSREILAGYPRERMGLSPGESIIPPHSHIPTDDLAVPFLEMRVKRLSGSKDSILNKNIYQTYNVMQARHLKSKEGCTCSAYIRVSVAPDPKKRTKCKTNVVPDTDYPIFDQKFSFELLEEDLKKRLLISVWDKHSNGKSDFIGCTSFGIRHLKMKDESIDGWYFLLSEDLGRKKHLKVSPHDYNVLTSTPKQKAVLSHDNLAQETIPSLLSLSMLKTDHKHHYRKKHKHTFKPKFDTDEKTDATARKGSSKVIIVNRGKDGGYGFSVTGSASVTVCSIQPNGPAMEAGLKEDDIIEKVNENDVLFSSADLVATLIREASEHIVLEVRRKTKPWTVWKPPTFSEIPEYVSARCPSPTSLSCDLISGICSFGKSKKKSQRL